MFNIGHHISTLSEVKAFAQYLYNDAKIAFHPDESFEEYVCVREGHSAFTKSEAAILNQYMEECFNICKKEKIDIYEYMMQFSPIHSFIK